MFEVHTFINNVRLKLSLGVFHLESNPDRRSTIDPSKTFQARKITAR